MITFHDCLMLYMWSKVVVGNVFIPKLCLTCCALMDGLNHVCHVLDAALVCLILLIKMRALFHRRGAN